MVDGVVNALPAAGLTVETLDREAVEGTQLVELLGMRALRALDRAVELGRARRQHEQAQAAALALGFEGGVELRTAVDLDGVPQTASVPRRC